MLLTGGVGLRWSADRWRCAAKPLASFGAPAVGAGAVGAPAVGAGAVADADTDASADADAVMSVAVSVSAPVISPAPAVEHGRRLWRATRRDACAAVAGQFSCLRTACPCRTAVAPWCSPCRAATRSVAGGRRSPAAACR